VNSASPIEFTAITYLILIPNMGTIVPILGIYKHRFYESITTSGSG
jgi:hypothetical protein